MGGLGSPPLSSSRSSSFRGRGPPRSLPLLLAWSAAAFLVSGAAADESHNWHKPWATHEGCAQIVRRFDFNANFSEQSYRRFHACLAKRKDLPDWHGPNRPALLSGEHYPVSVVPSIGTPPSYWVTPAWDYVVSNFIRRDGTYELAELQLFKSLVQEGQVVCDLGSHVGGYAVPLAFHVGPSGRVHAFEPFRLVFQLLLANVAINGLSNVYGHNMAVGEKADVARAKSPALSKSSNIGATSIYNQAKPVFGEDHVLQYDGEENVQVVTLDSLELQQVDFMKIDVEGMLEKVARGGEKTIRRLRPIIACEHEPESPPAILIGWGYRCVKVLPVHDLWVCVPKERWFRYRWLANAHDGRGVPKLPTVFGDENPEPGQSRRDGEPPKLVPNGQIL